MQSCQLCLLQLKGVLLNFIVMYPSDKRPLVCLRCCKKKRVKKRRLDNAVAGVSKILSFFVTTTAGEDETSEAIQKIANAMRLTMHHRYQRLKTKQRRNQQQRNQHDVAGSSGVRPDARQPDGSRRLSLKFQLGTLSIKLRSTILHHVHVAQRTIYPEPTNGEN